MSAVEWIPMVGMIFFYLMVLTIVVAWWRVRQKKIEVQGEVQTKLIERFGSSAELVEFLKSPTGREFVHGVQRGATVATQQRTLAGLRKAVVLSFLGLGLLTIWAISGAHWVAWFGVLFLALGLGFLSAAYLSFRLSRGTDETSVTNDVVSGA